MTTLTDTQVVTASGGLVELGYSQITSAVTVNNATAGTGVEVIAPLTVVCDGGPLLVEFFTQAASPNPTAGDDLFFSLFVDGSENNRYWGNLRSQAATHSGYSPVFLSRRITPSAGSHTFSVRAFVTNASRVGDIAAGAGGTAAAPAFLRVSKIVTATQWPAVTTGTIICTSTTRPASPFQGQRIYETDTKRELTYDGAGWYAFNQVLARVAQTSPVTTIAQADAIVAPAVSVAANRVIRLTANVHPYYTSAASGVTMPFFKDGVSIGQGAVPSVSITTSPASTVQLMHLDVTTAASSSVVYKLRFASFGGNTVGLYGNPGEAGWFTVEDIGPA